MCRSQHDYIENGIYRQRDARIRLGLVGWPHQDRGPTRRCAV